MTRKRPVKLTWTGDLLPDGRPAAHLGSYGIAPETIEGEALDALTVQQIAIARDSGLYRVTEAPEPKAAKKADKKAKAEPAPETPDDAPNGALVSDDLPAEPDEKGG